MPTRVNNNQARQYVERKEPFEASNTFAEWENGFYVVYSYGYHWVMFVYDSEADLWFENTDKYSRTTSRHHSQLKPYNIQMTPMEAHEIAALAQAGSFKDYTVRRLQGRKVA